MLSRLIVSDKQSSFIKLNCAELVPEMIARLRFTTDVASSHLQVSLRIGQSSNRPLVFLLDKIDKLHPQAQSEILLLLEGRAHCPHGQKDPMMCISGSLPPVRKTLQQFVQQGRFRKDLYYRLNVIPIFIPALRERKADIDLLIDYYIIEACAKTGKSFFIPEDSTRLSLNRFEWPGNINELKKLVYRMVMSGDESFIFKNYCIPKVSRSQELAELHSLGNEVLPDIIEIKKYLPEINTISLKNICDAFVSKTEKKLMRKALESTNWNRKKAAALLNISYKSMLNKIKAYDIL